MMQCNLHNMQVRAIAYGRTHGAGFLELPEPCYLAHVGCYVSVRGLRLAYWVCRRKSMSSLVSS